MKDDPLIPADLARRQIRRVDNSILNSSHNSNNSAENGQNCEIKDIETGIIVPYRPPPGVMPPGGTPSDAILSELRQISRLLYSQQGLLGDIRKYLSYETPTSNWLEVQRFTTVATPGAIGTVLQENVTDGLGIVPGYDTIDIYNLLQGRNAHRVWLVNDGVSGGVGDNLYLRTSPDGQNFSPEFIMLLGEIRIVSDVYEIRYRSPTRSVTLRASEREIYPPYVTTVENTFTATGTLNRGNFIARNITVGVADSILPNISVPDGFSLAIRANINNIGGSRIYVSRTNATVAANRNTLNVGDSIRLFVTNANLIHVAGTQAGLTVDLLTELT